MRFLQLLASIVPMAAAIAVARPNTIDGIYERTAPIVERDSQVTIDLTTDFNSPTALALIDNTLQQQNGVKRTGGTEVSWMTWSSVASVIKSRAKKPHQNTDPVVRVAIPIHVNTPWWCLAVNGHIVYYIFPDNTGSKFAGDVDAWDTLTANSFFRCVHLYSDAEFQTNSSRRHFLRATSSSIRSLVPCCGQNLSQIRWN
jgi:hypothetical protein